jgi:hypothetical protein
MHAVVVAVRMNEFGVNAVEGLMEGYEQVSRIDPRAGV